MCDFSLQHANSRPAKVADKLETKDFGRGTRGFADQADMEVAVCVLPGTEIAFDAPIQTVVFGMYMDNPSKVKGDHSVGIFRQLNRDEPHQHHDALEMPDGTHILLTRLAPGQHATVLQLPAKPKTEAEVKEQTRVAIAG